MADISGGAVSISATISPTAAISTDFGRTLYLGSEGTVYTTRAAAHRIRGLSFQAFANARGIADAGWPVGHQQAANTYFQQNPFPRTLLLASVNTAAQPSFVFGRAVTPTEAQINALGNSAAFTLNGVAISVDLSTAATLAGATSALVSAINGNAAFSGVSGAVVDGAIEFAIPGVNLETGFAAGTAANLLGLAGNGVDVLGSLDAETVVQALDRLENSNTVYYYLVVDPALITDAATATAIANWVNARTRQIFVDLTGEGTLTAGETTSIGATLFALGQNRVTGIWSDTTDHKALSFAARFSSIDFNQPNSLITGKFKLLPGTTPDRLTTTQREELDRKRINYFRRVGPGGSLSETGEGTSFGTWIDVQSWVDWFQTAIETDVYNLLRGSPRIPQTGEGVSALRNSIVGVCERGVRNGGIAPNDVSPEMALDIRQSTGNAQFDGFLSLGYLVWVGTLADQSQADRVARKAPPFKVWVKGSGAVHFVEISAAFES